jgi:hypothetical protein
LTTFLFGMTNSSIFYQMKCPPHFIVPSFWKEKFHFFYSQKYSSSCFSWGYDLWHLGGTWFESSKHAKFKLLKRFQLLSSSNCLAFQDKCVNCLSHCFLTIQNLFMYLCNKKSSLNKIGILFVWSYALNLAWHLMRIMNQLQLEFIL